jgi:hypothetical protein
MLLREPAAETIVAEHILHLGSQSTKWSYPELVEGFHPDGNDARRPMYKSERNFSLS